MHWCCYATRVVEHLRSTNDWRKRIEAQRSTKVSIVTIEKTNTS
jgi:hypothetical protein